MARDREEAWLTARARRLLADARALLPVNVRDSQLIESALETYVAKLRGPRKF